MNKVARQSIRIGKLAGCVALAAALGLHAAARAQAGSAERQVDARGAQGVSLRIPADLRLQQGAVESLVIEAEAKVLDRIEVTRREGVLIIDSKAPGFQTQRPIVLRLTLRDVRYLHADSAGSIHAQALSTRHLDIELDGSADLSIARLEAQSLTLRLSGSGACDIAEGRVGVQDVELTGSGDYAAPGLISARARVAARSSGSARVQVSERLDADIQGSGDIEFSGPAKVYVREDGAGEVRRRP